MGYFYSVVRHPPELAKPMTADDSSQQEGTSSGRGVTSLLAALIVLISLMVASYFYPYPSGKRPDFLSLLMFWGREVLIVITALVVLVAVAISAIFKAKERRGGPDA